MIRESLTVTALLIASSLGFAAYLMLKPTVLRWMRKHPRRRKLAFIVQVFVPLILALALSKMEFRELHD